MENDEFHSQFSILCGPPSVFSVPLWFVYSFSDLLRCKRTTEAQRTPREEHRGKYKRIEGNEEWRTMNSILSSQFSVVLPLCSLCLCGSFTVFRIYFGANELQRHREHRGKSTEVNIRGSKGMKNGER